MVKYYLYRLDWSRDNVRVSEKYRFVFEDLANIWIYTNSRKINSEYEKVSIKESIIPYNVKEWILECEIILSKEKIIKYAPTKNIDIKSFLYVLDAELQKCIEKGEDI